MYCGNDRCKIASTRFSTSIVSGEDIGQPGVGLVA
jgi:hypothetical protein